MLEIVVKHVNKRNKENKAIDYNKLQKEIKKQEGRTYSLEELETLCEYVSK